MTVFDKNMVVTASILAAVTIAIGAFGAHGLKNLVDASSLISFETGVRYQMYHCLAIFVLGCAPVISTKTKKTVFALFLLGILLFSGSIYLLSLNEILPFNSLKIGFVTPIGGLLFIIGWLWLGYGVFSSKRE